MNTVAILITILLTAGAMGLGWLITVNTKDGLSNADYFIWWD